MRVLTILFILFFQTSLYAQLGNIQTTNGFISGINKENISIYKGIPFAAPPTGDLRWKAPQKTDNWEGIRKCENYGPSAMQPEQQPFMVWSQEFLIPNDPMSEDCLYLNIWTPAKSDSEKLPVVVWIHGGGFMAGGAACPIYDGEEMAKKGVVFVSINYRVGVFGFLVHPELTKEAGTSGNYGILDMIASLKWVKENIAAFGGDPGNVTIAGQSAGSMAVNFLVVSPMAKGLFNKAIAHSGANMLNNPMRSLPDFQEAEQQGVNYATKLDVFSLDGLRAKSGEEILKANGGTRSPIIDGIILPKDASAIFVDREQNDVALMAGWTKEDILFPPPPNLNTYISQAKKRFGNKSDAFLALYPASTDEEAKRVSGEAGRDEFFGVQMYTWFIMQSKYGNSQSFWYYFTRNLPAYTEETEYGAFHTGDIPYAFNNLKMVNRPFTDIDNKLADVMSDYWVNFAKFGDPNGKGLPDWPAFNTNNPQTMILGDKIESMTHPSQQQLEFWVDFYRND